MRFCVTVCVHVCVSMCADVHAGAHECMHASRRRTTTCAARPPPGGSTRPRCPFQHHRAVYGNTCGARPPERDLVPRQQADNPAAPQTLAVEDRRLRRPRGSRGSASVEEPQSCQKPSACQHQQEARQAYRPSRKRNAWSVHRSCRCLPARPASPGSPRALLFPAGPRVARW